MTAVTESARIELHGITKSFSGRRVLGPVSFTARSGEVVGVVGENGAGKSTLLNILSGVLAPDSGQIRTDGAQRQLDGYRKANELGIFRVYQDSFFIPTLTVEENLLLGWEDRFTGPLGTIRKGARRATAQRAVERLGLPASILTVRAGTLGVGVRQLLAFAKVVATVDALGAQRPVILLDEPTTSLDVDAERTVMDVVEELRADGATIVLVSHLLGEVLARTSRIVVLKDGEITAQVESASSDEAELHRLMVGREREHNYYLEDEQGGFGTTDTAGEPVLEVVGLTAPALSEPLSFTVRGGEILGFVGLEGSGKSEVGLALAGAVGSAGTVRVRGRRVRRGSLAGAIAAGLVYVPADRAALGVLGTASIADNITVASAHDRFAGPAGTVRAGASRRETRRLIELFGVAARRGETQPIGELSGGNQQKVLLARWFSRDPAVIVLDSPTQGVDTGARSAIYHHIRRAARSGAAVVLISEDLTEVIGLSDRVVVLGAGRVRSTVDAAPGAKPDEEAIVAQMMS